MVVGGLAVVLQLKITNTRKSKSIFISRHRTTLLFMNLIHQRLHNRLHLGRIVRRKYRSKSGSQNRCQPLRQKTGRRFRRTDNRENIRQNGFVRGERSGQLIEQRFARLNVRR